MSEVIIVAKRYVEVPVSLLFPLTATKSKKFNHEKDLKWGFQRKDMF